MAALRAIASKLQVKGSLPTCERSTEYDDKPAFCRLACDCNATTKMCHVIRIQLKSQNLNGSLPEELAQLKSLIHIDLTRNYLNGTIPASWASLPLVNISLLGNRISGRIPDEFGNISTLQELVLEDNVLGGPLPSSLGRLKNLRRLLLSANNFTGEIPETFGDLASLTDFRIDGSAISGKIPDSIGSWSKLHRLDMQGTSLGGPFPATFANLKELTDLRISDFGGDGNYPPLDARNMLNLVLRNCNISRPIPPYIHEMRNLTTLDLSFNNFTGQIPSFIQTLYQIRFMYFTNNNLTGPIPSWLLKKADVDLSYNSFTGSISTSCQNGRVNLASSYSSTESNPGNFCLRKNLPCSGKAQNYKLFINCGGGKEIVGEDEYDEDIRDGASLFYASGENWAVSSTGNFMGGNESLYLANNISVLSTPTPDSTKLYMQARMSPLSLRYYGLCLQNGNYTVKLHFAEISFTDDQTYFAVGRRFFDVSIQGQKVLKDFNIAQAANGTGRAINCTFFAMVKNHTLEIHFQWAGKGTTAIPTRGVYGPLISAISVTPNFRPEIKKGPPSVGAIVGITIASCMVVVLLVFFLSFFLREKPQENDELRGLELPGGFTLRQIKSATGNFNPVNKIGEGGFGPVYKGELSDGSLIAVKQLSSKSRQGSREFVNEIGMITALQHPNLVKLFGCCIEGNQLLLIYEYMENNSLACALFGPEGQKLNLNWQTRREITRGIARGLAFLHEESRLKIVHRDIKATNILLDKDLNAKISDFGLAKLDDEENTHISTRIAGTLGYMAPEYAMRGYLTDKADVYSFGVVILEIVSGRSNANYRPKEESVYLLDWAYVLQERGALLELVDPCLGSAYSITEAEQMLNLALLCTNLSPTLRPTMSTVVSILEGDTVVRAASVAPSGATTGEEGTFKSFERLSHDSHVLAVSGDGPWINSSATMSNKEDVSLLSATSY